MIRVVIMCQGQQSRLPHLAIPKQLLPLPLCNTTILDRTLKILEEHPDVREIVILGSDYFYEHLTGSRWQGGMTVLSYKDALSRDWKNRSRYSYGENPTYATVSTMMETGGGGRSPIGIDHVELVAPGNSILRGLQEIRAYLAQETHDRTVILLGDVVYSRRALAALIDPGPDQTTGSDISWVVSSDLSPGAGEVFGLSYIREATQTFCSLLSAVAHPPFVPYQPGQLRRLLWDWQTQAYRGDSMLRQWPEFLRSQPYRRCCHVLNDPNRAGEPFDFTKDIDTEIDLMRLGQLDSAAFYDDHPELATALAYHVQGGRAYTITNAPGPARFAPIAANKEGE